MQSNEILVKIKPNWIKRISLTMARGSALKEDLIEQLVQFFDQLQIAVETGDPEWFDPLLQKWSGTLTQTDLKGEQNSLTRIIRELIDITQSICLENLSAEDFVTALNSILPIFSYVYEKTSLYETNAKIAFYKKEITEMQNSIVKTNRSKSGFITIAAHELKTPLTLIEGYSAMLAENLRKEIWAQKLSDVDRWNTKGDQPIKKSYR